MRGAKRPSTRESDVRHASLSRRSSPTNYYGEPPNLADRAWHDRSTTLTSTKEPQHSGARAGVQAKGRVAVDQRGQFSGSCLAKLMQLEAEGYDPTHGGAAEVKRGLTNARPKSELREWEQQYGKLVDLTTFEREILPLISEVPLSQLVKATGLSLRYVSQTRRGERCRTTPLASASGHGIRGRARWCEPFCSVAIAVVRLYLSRSEPQHPKHWSGWLPARTVFVSVIGKLV